MRECPDRRLHDIVKRLFNPNLGEYLFIHHLYDLPLFCILWSLFPLTPHALPQAVYGSVVVSVQAPKLDKRQRLVLQSLPEKLLLERIVVAPSRGGTGGTESNLLRPWPGRWTSLRVHINIQYIYICIFHILPYL